MRAIGASEKIAASASVYDRQHRVAESVGDDHGARRQAAGPRGAHEIRRQHRQHRGPRHARDRRQREDRQRQRRQDQLAERGAEGLEIARDQRIDQIEAGHRRRRAVEHVEPPERRRRPAEPEIEDIDQHQPGEEHRQRHARRGRHPAEMIDPGARPGRGENAERHARSRSRPPARAASAPPRPAGGCGFRSRPAGPSSAKCRNRHGRDRRCSGRTARSAACRDRASCGSARPPPCWRRGRRNRPRDRRAARGSAGR